MKMFLPNSRLKSVDLTNHALVTPKKPKRWELIGKRKRGEKLAPVPFIATIMPRPGKGFEWAGQTFSKMEEAKEAIRNSGRNFTHYRQGGAMAKNGLNKIFPLGVAA